MKISSSLIPTGDLVEEIHQVFSDWSSQVIRVYKEESHVELEWLMGPIPINDNKGKEPISRFTTNLATNKIFYTDSNGREMLRRERNHRPTWDVELAEPASGNYYPVTSKIVHRRLLNDDAKGVDEALNETAYGEGLIARGRHFVFAGEIAGSNNVSLAAQERLLAQRILLAPWVFISRGSAAQTRSVDKKQASSVVALIGSTFDRDAIPDLSVIVFCCSAALECAATEAGSNNLHGDNNDDNNNNIARLDYIIRSPVV
uniref:Glycosyl hydrolase family 38 C-terminal domain-containing protein n=1 Tax=Timema douglasi TaxID=61478 RepID=A0A7R8VYR8_TIMDO|nr:unnamed protein product [Timema douglasi]